MGNTISTREGGHHRGGGRGDATDEQKKSVANFIGQRVDDFVEHRGRAGGEWRDQWAG